MRKFRVYVSIHTTEVVCEDIEATGYTVIDGALTFYREHCESDLAFGPGFWVKVQEVKSEV